MKTKIFFSALVFCILSFLANAQISVGFRAAYGKAWEDYGGSLIPENAVIHIPAYQFSGLMNFGLGKNIGISIEPGYVQRGAACIPEFITFESDRKFMLSYAEVPLVVTGRVPVFNHKFEIFGKAGYGISYMVKGSQVFIDLTGVRDPEVVAFDFKNPFGINVTRWDNGIYGGMGIGYHLPIGQLFLESNFYMGMRNVSNNATSKSRNVHVGLGYQVSL